MGVSVFSVRFSAETEDRKKKERAIDVRLKVNLRGFTRAACRNGQTRKLGTA